VTAWIPGGFELIREEIGSGKTSMVSLVRRVEDGALFAMKTPRSSDPTSRALLGELVERSRVLAGLDIARGEIIFDPDGRVLLQPFVEGPSLRELFCETDLLTDPDDLHLPALIDLFARIIREGFFVSGLNAENLIFDGGRFEIIDCGALRPTVSAYGAWRRQRQKLLRHWIRFDDHNPGVIRAFLKRLQAGLGLSPVSLRDWLRFVLTGR
jgi:hypothetical protein